MFQDSTAHNTTALNPSTNKGIVVGDNQHKGDIASMLLMLHLSWEVRGDELVCDRYEYFFRVAPFSL